MANIKITELNGITKKASDDVLAIVDVSANETKKIAVEDLLDKNIELIAVTDIEPSECSYGEKYYNTTDKLIYTAIATDTWSEDGEEPISGILYIVYNEQASYSWNGTDLISVGGGKEDIVIDDEEPTDPDVKLWIDTGEIGSAVSEITNEYSTSTGFGYSCNYVNGIIESGSNTKGNWIKFADGTLIQHGANNLTTGTISYTHGYTHYGVSEQIDLPIEFIDSNYNLTANSNTPIDYISNINVNRATTSKIEIRFQCSQMSYTRLIYWIAIGRWK